MVARAAAQREADIAAGRAQLTGEPWNEEVSRTWGQFVHVVTACMKDSRGTYKNTPASSDESSDAGRELCARHPEVFENY